MIRFGLRMNKKWQTQHIFTSATISEQLGSLGVEINHVLIKYIFHRSGICLNDCGFVRLFYTEISQLFTVQQ